MFLCVKSWGEGRVSDAQHPDLKKPLIALLRHKHLQNKNKMWGWFPFWVVGSSLVNMLDNSSLFSSVLNHYVLFDILVFRIIILSQISATQLNYSFFYITGRQNYCPCDFLNDVLCSCCIMSIGINWFLQVCH